MASEKEKEIFSHLPEWMKILNDMTKEIEEQESEKY